MIKKIKYWLAAVALLLPLASPLTALAAYNDVTTDGTANIVLPSTGLSYNILSTSKAVYYKVNDNGSSIDLSMDNGSLVEITSNDKSSFTVSNAGTCSNSTSCGGQSYVYVSCTAAQVVTVTMGAANTCSGGSTGGSTSGSGGGGGGASTPAATTPSTPAVVAVVTPIPAPQPAIQESGITFSNTPSAGLQPGDSLAFQYEYKHAGKTMTIKFVRQLLDGKNKIVKTSTASKKLADGKSYQGSVSELVSKAWGAGDYTMRVRALDTKNKVITENSFSLTVEKLKQKTFVMGEMASADSAVAFDAATLAKVRSGVRLPANLKVKYSYTNTTGASQTVRMVRELLNSSDKVLSTKTGNWKMKPGESDSQTFTQAVAGNLSSGEYSVRIRAYDSKTKEVLAENSVHFTIELR